MLSNNFTQKSSKKINNPTLSVMIGYGSGYFGYGFITQMMTSYLVFYATALLLLSGSVVGFIVSISVVWDAVSDPVMGYLSDKTKSRFGKRHLYIIIGGLGIAVCNLYLWQIDSNATTLAKFYGLLVSIVLIKTFITIYITPYNALGAEMSSDYHERSKIQAIKTMYFLSAFVIVTAVCMFIFFKPTQAYPLGQLNPLAYRNIAYTSSLIMILTGAWTYLSTRRYIVSGQSSTSDVESISFKSFYNKSKYSLIDPDFRNVFIGYLLTNLASAIISVVGLHTFTYTFGMNNYEIGIVFGTQFFISIISQPYWISVAKKMDKKRTIIVGLKISIAACLLLFSFVIMRTLVIEHYQYLLIYAVVIGFGTSGLFSLPLSMVADIVDKQEYHTTNRNEGLYYGMLNFGYKISQSLAIFLLGFFIDLIKFNGELSVQLDSTNFLMGALLSIGSLIVFILATLAYSNYSLNEDRVSEMQRDIKDRI